MSDRAKPVFRHDQVMSILRADGILMSRQVAASMGRSKRHIVDFWRRFPKRPTFSMNGVPWEYARIMCPRCPTLLTPAAGGTQLCTWADLEEIGVHGPAWLVDAVRVMAKFQRALHGARNAKEVREALCKILTRERP